MGRLITIFAVGVGLFVQQASTIPHVRVLADLLASIGRAQSYTEMSSFGTRGLAGGMYAVSYIRQLIPGVRNH